MGSPHLRCLEMHQSARPSVMERIRLAPVAGIHSTVEMASSACWRKPSTEANHCSRQEQRFQVGVKRQKAVLARFGPY